MGVVVVGMLRAAPQGASGPRVMVLAPERRASGDPDQIGRAEAASQCQVAAQEGSSYWSIEQRGLVGRWVAA
jgi:hypothetical protein